MALPILKPNYAIRACSWSEDGPDSGGVRRMQDEERYWQRSEKDRYFITTEVNSKKTKMVDTRYIILHIMLICYAFLVQWQIAWLPVIRTLIRSVEPSVYKRDKRSYENY